MSAVGNVLRSMGKWWGNGGALGRQAARRRGLAFPEALESRLMLDGVPLVQGLDLYADTGTPGDGATSDATITGSADVSPSGWVEFDYDGDGNFDNMATPDAAGSFLFDVGPDVGYGPVSVQARAVDWDDPSGQYVAGGWSAALNFTYEPEPIADVVGLQLANDTGTPGDNITQDATVTGSADVSPSGWIEFDYDGDGSFDNMATPDAAGTFQFDVGSDVGYGPVSVQARAVDWDEPSGQYLAGDWSAPLNFTFEPTPMPDVTGLQLANDTGTPGDNITQDATITGQVDPSAAEGVELDFDGDGWMDGQASLDGNGYFIIDADPSVDYGGVAASARSFAWDAVAGATVFGAWSPVLAFTYVSTETAPQITELYLANDTGEPDDMVTEDPTIAGETEANVTVEIDVDGDGTVDAVTASDGNGQFSIDLSENLPYGESTVRVRGIHWNGAEFLDGDWAEIDVTYNRAPVITSFIGIHVQGDVFRFEGTVDDEAPLGAGVVTFGGILDGHQAIIKADGTFTLTIELDDWGVAFAQTTDEYGTDSNEALDFISPW